MVVFDEMNLGQVEHYFSDFISVLEAPKGRRKLKLFSEKSICHQEEYKNGIEIGENVLFIGTANFDETTKEFSNRLLDRANVLILEKKGFIEAKLYEEEENNKDSGLLLEDKIHISIYMSQMISKFEHLLSITKRA